MELMLEFQKEAQVPYSRLRGFERGKVGPIDGKIILVVIMYLP
jgi:hypothetical protein